LNAPIAVPTTSPARIASGAVTGWPMPRPRSCGITQTCTSAITAEQTARSEPTDRSIWRVTITNTMPVAMMATDAVWIVRLKMFRGVRNLCPVSR